MSNVDYFNELPFCNVSIEKPITNCLRNTDLLGGLPFYDQLNIIRTEQAFSGYATSYKVEIVNKIRFDCAIRRK